MNSQIREELPDLKCRKGRDNFIFTNIPEKHQEDTEQVPFTLLETELNLFNIKIERVHRLKIKHPTNRKYNKDPYP